MIEEKRPTNLSVIDKGGMSVVVCQTCNRLIVQDNGHCSDLLLVYMAVQNHLNNPRYKLPHGGSHVILTVIMSTLTPREGLITGKDFYIQ